MASNSSSLTTGSQYDKYLAKFGQNDDDGANVETPCDVCNKTGEFVTENYHNGVGKFPTISVYHNLPHDFCKKAWYESIIENGVCSICTGEAVVTSVNGKRLSLLRRERASEESTEKKEKTSTKPE